MSIVTDVNSQLTVMLFLCLDGQWRGNETGENPFTDLNTSYTRMIEKKQTLLRVDNRQLDFEADNLEEQV